MSNSRLSSVSSNTRGEPSDRLEIIANLMALYEDTGRPDKAKELEKEFHELGSAKKPANHWYYWTKRAICGILNP
jgi:hypothetical protein